MSQPETATLAEFARLANRKRSYITELKATGRLAMTDDGKRVRVAESLALIAATRDPSKAGVVARHEAAREAAGATAAAAPASAPPREESEDEDGSDGYQHWRKRNERAKALAAERDNRLRDGELLEAADVTATASAAIVTLRNRLESLPDVLGPQLAAEQDEGRVRALLAETIEHALEETSRQFYQLGRAEVDA